MNKLFDKLNNNNTYSSLCMNSMSIIYVIYLGFLYTCLMILYNPLYTIIAKIAHPNHNKILIKYNKNPDKVLQTDEDIKEIIYSTFIDIIAIVLSAYIIRKIVKYIPFGLNKICNNFNRYNVGEINGGIILGVGVLTYYSFSTKLKIYKYAWSSGNNKIFKYIIKLLICIILIGYMSNYM